MQTHENVMLSGTRQSGRKITISHGCFSSCGRVGPPPWGTVWTVLLSVKWCEPWRDQRFGGLEIWGWFPEFPVTMSQWGRNKLSRCTWFSLCYTLPYIYIYWKRSLKIDGCGAKPTVLLGWFTPLLRSQSASRRPDAGLPCHGVNILTKHALPQKMIRNRMVC